MSCWKPKAETHESERLLVAGRPSHFVTFPFRTPVLRKSPSEPGQGECKANCPRPFPQQRLSLQGLRGTSQSFLLARVRNFILARVREFCPTPALSNPTKERKTRVIKGRHFKERDWKQPEKAAGTVREK